MRRETQGSASPVANSEEPGRAVMVDKMEAVGRFRCAVSSRLPRPTRYKSMQGVSVGYSPTAASWPCSAAYVSPLYEYPCAACSLHASMEGISCG